MFTAARYFIERSNEREKSEALVLLGHWMAPQAADPKDTNDPAQWDDWRACVDRVLGGRLR